MKRLLFALLICLMMTPAAMAVEKVAGVEFSDNLKELVLNGAGVRKKAFIKVYALGLYLKAENKDAAAIINADEPMAIKLVITTGLVSKEKMQKAMTEGFEGATSGNTAALKDKIDTFNNCFSDEIVKEDEFLMTYTPEAGVVVTKNGTHKGTITGIDFKKALFGIWLGEKPADDGLKKDMLD